MATPQGAPSDSFCHDYSWGTRDHPLGHTQGAMPQDWHTSESVRVVEVASSLDRMVISGKSRTELAAFNSIDFSASLNDLRSPSPK